MSKKNFTEWYYDMTPRQRAAFAVESDTAPRHMAEQVMKRTCRPSVKLMQRMASNSGYKYKEILLHFYDE